ncbi:MAG: CARDB domain-containing protein, partial [Candidatus Jordarchaeaceae archaeon]
MKLKFASLILCFLILISWLLVISSEMRTVSALPEKYPKWQYQTVGTTSSAAISGNGAYIVSSSSDGYLYLFRPDSNIPLDAVSIGGSAAILEFSFYGVVVAAAFQNTVKLFTVNGSRLYPIASFTNNPGYSGGINSLSFSADGRYLAIGTWLNTGYYRSSKSYVHVFDVLMNKILWSREISAPDAYYAYDNVTVAISSDGNFIVAGSTWNKCVYLFSILSSTPMIAYDTGGPVNSVSISSNGAYFIAGGNRIYYFSKNVNVPIWSRDLGRSIISTSLSSSAENVLACSDGGSIHLLTVNNTIIRSIVTYSNIRFVVFSGNDRGFLGMSSDKLFLYSLDLDGDPSTPQLEPLWSFTPGSSLTSSTISSDSRYVAVTSGNFLYILDATASPDFLTTKITFSNNSPTEGDAVTIVATIMNAGTLSSPPASISFYDDKGLIGRKTVDSLAPNSEANVSILFYASSEGIHTIKVVVDEFNLILESDETNNEAKVVLTVGSLEAKTEE